ncbi:MAG: hypothetical protein V4844_02290 [Pseudomonadota bacterium]
MFSKFLKTAYVTLRNQEQRRVTSNTAAVCLALALGAGMYGSAEASATSVYLAQSAQGSADGSSCVNARAASWFNSSSNWGVSTSQIGAGTTVRLCGSISTNLTFQGSGASGSPVVLNGSGATYSGEVNTANKSWWNVQNITWVDGYAGTLVTIVGGSNGVVANNYADNIRGAFFLAQYNGAVLPSNITIANNFLRQTTADLGNTQNDLIVTEGSTNVVVEGNYLEMRAGGSGSYAHNDAIQTYQKGGASGGPPGDWTIRYNKIVMNSNATNDRSWMMLEGLRGTINIYSNVFLGLNGGSAANGIATCCNQTDVVFNIFNNTLVSKGSASNNVFNLNAPGVANLKNNIVYTQWQTTLTGGMTVKRDHNLWFGSNIPSCSGGIGEICGVNPQFTNYAGNDFSLLSTSPVLTGGVNLGAAYGKAIAKGATWPNPQLEDRPATGNWALGAGGLGSAVAAVQLPPPVSLRVVN